MLLGCARVANVWQNLMCHFALRLAVLLLLARLGHLLRLKTTDHLDDHTQSRPKGCARCAPAQGAERRGRRQWRIQVGAREDGDAGRRGGGGGVWGGGGGGGGGGAAPPRVYLFVVALTGF